MKHQLYSSVEEMLAPKKLSELSGQYITSAKYHPLNSDEGKSGSQLLAIETNNGQGPRYVLKRISPEWDWLMLTTEDKFCRSVAIWQHGLLDRLKPHVDHSIMACAKDGAGWAILMHDVSEGLIPDDQPLSVADNARILEAMAAQHAIFWKAPELTDPKLGLCSLSVFFQTLSPEMVHRREESKNVLPHMLLEGWELLQEMIEPDVASMLQVLMRDPQPLCDALTRYPYTLLHGDLQFSNFSLMRNHRTQVTILDWQLAAVGPATADLGWYITYRLPISTEAAIEYYRQQLAHYLGNQFDKDIWQPLLELGLLGNFIRQSCFMAWNVVYHEDERERTYVRGRLPWWSEQVRAAVKWL